MVFHKSIFETSSIQQLSFIIFNHDFRLPNGPRCSLKDESALVIWKKKQPCPHPASQPSPKKNLPSQKIDMFMSNIISIKKKQRALHPNLFEVLTLEIHFFQFRTSRTKATWKRRHFNKIHLEFHSPTCISDVRSWFPS